MVLYCPILYLQYLCTYFALVKESDQFKREAKEAGYIRSLGSNLNRDKGQHNFSTVKNSILFSQ